MSVGGVDNKGRGSEIENRNRNDSTAKEAEMNKRYAAELSRLRQEHYEKIQELEAAHQKQMDTEHGATREALTAKDRKYQQEIEEMQKLNREKVTNLTSNFEDKMNRTRGESKATLEGEKRVHDMQRKTMAESFQNSYKQKEKGYEEAFENTKKLQQEGMQKTKVQLDEKHAEEMKFLVQNRDENVDRLSNDLRTTRRAKAAGERDFRNSNLKNKNEMEDKFMDVLGGERRTASEQQNLTKKNFDESLDSVRDRYGKALADERERNQENYQKLNDTANGRGGSETRYLERKIKALTKENQDKLNEVKRQAAIERRDLYAEMGDNLSASDKQRQAAIEDSNRRNADEISKFAKSNAEAFHFQDGKNKENLNMMKVHWDDEVAQKETSFSAETDKLKRQSLVRDKKFQEVNQRERKVTDEYYQRSLTEMKRTFDDTLTQQRSANLQERNLMMDHLQKQMRANDAKTEERMNLTISGYEKQIGDMKSQHLKDMESIKKDYDGRLKGEQKMGQQNLESQKLKYETQIASMRENYEDRIRKLQKNIEEEKIRSSKSTT